MLCVLKWAASWLAVSLPLHNSVTFDTRAFATVAATSVVGRIQSVGSSDVHLTCACWHAVRRSLPN